LRLVGAGLHEVCLGWMGRGSRFDSSWRVDLRMDTHVS
jgi:hypothetical protein